MTACEPASVGIQSSSPSTECYSDGTREIFTDPLVYPDICGCAGKWNDVKSIRAASSGSASCGGSVTCNVPSDLCAPGYEPCDVTGLRTVTAAECHNQAGVYLTGFSHCSNKATTCSYNFGEGTYSLCASGASFTDVPDCSQSACCGTGCDTTTCTSGIWSTESTYMGPTSCGLASSTSVTGLMCCRMKDTAKIPVVTAGFSVNGGATVTITSQSCLGSGTDITSVILAGAPVKSIVSQVQDSHI